MIKVCIPSHGRAKTISSHRLFYPRIFQVTILVHDEEQFDKYSENPEVKGLVQIGSREKGCCSQKHWILENLISKDEWYICIDDNVERITGIPDSELFPLWKNKQETLEVKSNKELREVFGQTIDSFQLKKIFETMTILGNAHHLYFQGFAIVNNPFFRLKQYRSVGFVVGKMNFIKKTFLNYDKRFKVKDDYDFTAQHLSTYGGVMINNYIFPEGKHYQKGGLGSLKAREPQSIADAKLLMEKYPGLFRYKDRPGRAKNSEVAIRFTSTEQLNKWRGI